MKLLLKKWKLFSDHTGSLAPFYRKKSFKDNEFFYDYLKKEIKSKRKMGHLTIIDE